MVEFRFVYTTDRYEDTVAFWAEHLGLERVGGWDRGPDDRGALFAAAGAVVEVIRADRPAPLTDALRVALQVDDPDAWHARAVAAGAPSEQEPEDMPWRHRNATVVDPNGLRVTFFSKLPGAAT